MLVWCGASTGRMNSFTAPWNWFSPVGRRKCPFCSVFDILLFPQSIVRAAFMSHACPWAPVSHHFQTLGHRWSLLMESTVAGIPHLVSLSKVVSNKPGLAQFCCIVLRCIKCRMQDNFQKWKLFMRTLTMSGKFPVLNYNSQYINLKAWLWMHGLYCIAQGLSFLLLFCFTVKWHVDGWDHQQELLS